MDLRLCFIPLGHETWSSSFEAWKGGTSRLVIYHLATGPEVSQRLQQTRNSCNESKTAILAEDSPSTRDGWYDHSFKPKTVKSRAKCKSHVKYVLYRIGQLAALLENKSYLFIPTIPAHLCSAQTKRWRRTATINSNSNSNSVRPPLRRPWYGQAVLAAIGEWMAHATMAARRRRKL